MTEKILQVGPSKIEVCFLIVKLSLYRRIDWPLLAFDIDHSWVGCDRKLLCVLDMDHKLPVSRLAFEVDDLGWFSFQISEKI